MLSHLLLSEKKNNKGSLWFLEKEPILSTLPSNQAVPRLSFCLLCQSAVTELSHCPRNSEPLKHTTTAGAHSAVIGKDKKPYPISAFIHSTVLVPRQGTSAKPPTSIPHSLLISLLLALTNMVLCEDLECGVCCQSYSRSKRVPRMLFCNHTFCTTCLETMSMERGSMLSVRCPLCRQVSCVRRGLGLQNALWVNSCLWDCIAEAPEQEQEEEGQEEEKRNSATAQAVPPAQSEWWRPSSTQNRPKLRLLSFLKRLSSPRQPQERIVPGCNVQMKSWRKLSGEETF
ncbi:hypothetical protein MHYP_G00334430 [Metynnis hypsauchen]